MHLSWIRRVAVLGLGAVGAASLAIGCMGTADTLANKRAFEGQPTEDPGTDADVFGQSDAGRRFDYRGSPLCRVTADTCSPDDDGLRRLTETLECAVAAPKNDADASVDVDASPPQPVDAKGCRLTVSSGTGSSGSGSTAPQPACGDASFDGTDGVACEKGSDCAPGFDCVDGDQGAVCRRYCCAGTCLGQHAANGSKTFCDVQTLHDSPAYRAPVCMPIKTCKLLVAGQCSEKETCAVVDETGATGCVANGSAKAGDSCDEEHCNVGLTCLGQPGSRTCYQLCRMNPPSCGPTEVCKTSALFKDADFGVCKPL